MGKKDVTDRIRNIQNKQYGAHYRSNGIFFTAGSVVDGKFITEPVA